MCLKKRFSVQEKTKTFECVQLNAQKMKKKASIKYINTSVYLFSPLQICSYLLLAILRQITELKLISVSLCLLNVCISASLLWPFQNHTWNLHILEIASVNRLKDLPFSWFAVILLFSCVVVFMMYISVIVFAMLMLFISVFGNTETTWLYQN